MGHGAAQPSLGIRDDDDGELVMMMMMMMMMMMKACVKNGG